MLICYDFTHMHTYAHLPPHPQTPPDKQTRHWLTHGMLPGKTEINFSFVHPTMRNSHLGGGGGKPPLNKYAPKVKACVDGGRHLPTRKTSLGASWFQAAMMRSRQTQPNSSREAVPHPRAAPGPEREPLEKFNPKFMVTAHERRLFLRVSRLAFPFGWIRTHRSVTGGFHTSNK